MARTPVLFVHAFPFDARMWRPQLDGLGKSRLALAPDLRGFGTRGQGTFPESAAQHARDLLEILDEATVPHAAVVGLSMGGYIAFALQRLAPDRIAGLMLADTQAGADTPEAKKQRDLRIDKVLRDGVSFLPDEMIPALVAPSCPEPIKLEVRRLILEQHPLGVAAALRVLRDRPDSTATLSTIRVPTSVVCGEHDALTPPSVMKQMASQIPGARFVTIPNAGHLANLEAPAQFNRALAEFLARVDSA